jgi:hypothetical protein
VIATALEFARAYENGGFSAKHREAFNMQATARYEGIRDYIVAHYRMNQRTDSQYWRDNAGNEALSDGLKAMITAWFTHGDLETANVEAYGEPHYSAMSWHALFAGYGTFPPVEKMQPLPLGSAGADLQAVSAMLDACEHNFADFAVMRKGADAAA